MAWRDIGYAKKGLIIGLLIGVIFGIYSNVTNCHTSPGGPSGCQNSFELFIAGIEFLLMIGPYLLFIAIIPDTFAFRILIFLSPIIFFSLIGLLIGWILGKIKSSRKQK